MADRILIHVGNLMDVAAGNDSFENQMIREMRDLADELNSALPYEVRLVHLDTMDYLEFIQREAKEAG